MTENSCCPTAGGRRAVVEEPLTALSINTIRTLSMDAVQAANSGHPGTPMALAPLAYALWARIARYDGTRPDWADRDRIVLSAGHASMLLYSVLHLTGDVLTLDDIKQFRQWGSPTAGHPEYGVVPGVETTTGPLGQGVGNAIGMALTERILAARFNRPDHEIVDHRTWVIAGDGDLMEGVSQEAASLAGHLGLGKLCVFYDDNRITIDGTTDITFSEDVGARFEAYGWQVLRVGDHEGVAGYVTAAEEACRETERPTLVVCRTHIGYGSPHKQDTPAAHGAPLGEEEIRLTKRCLDWPEDESFLVPPEVFEHMQEAGRRGQAASADWDARLAAYREAHPEEAAELERRLRGDLPSDWTSALPTFEAGGTMATRKASGTVLNAIAGAVPELVGGSADLAGSNKTVLEGEGFIGAETFAARNIHYGIREHAMGAIMNGMALHGGVLPYGGTFFVFSDYMRPSIRLAALMDLRVVYVFTHDSVGVGEDGPTHQPIEHLAALRSIPGLTVIRPADGAETAQAWRAALEADGPTALVLTRQGLPELDHANADAARLARGAYVVRGADGPVDVLLLASGSEVQHALGAADLLEADGISSRVVSFPSWELFDRLDASERAAVLGEARARVGVEAGCSQGWHRWVGEGGGLVTIDRFGASAPGSRLMQEFGMTAENVARVAREALGSA